MPYYPIGNGTIITPQWFNDIQNRLYNSDTGEYKQWLDSDLSDNAGQIKSRLTTLTDEFKVTGITGLYANINGGKAKTTLGTIVTVPNGTVLCTDNAINYICLNKDGSINSYTSIQGMVLAKLTLSNGVLVSNEDMRARWLLFDINDIQKQIVSKTESFIATKNSTHLVTPSQNINISLPDINSLVPGDSFYVIIASTQYTVTLQNNNIPVNNQLATLLLSPNNIYQFTVLNETVGWYASISPLEGTFKSTALQDMPSSLISNKILQVNLAGDKYLLSDYPSNRWTLVNAEYTALNNDRIFADTSGGAFAINLPATPVAGDYIEIFGNFATNNLTVRRNGLTIDGAAQNITLSSDKQVCRFFYTGTTWVSSSGSAVAESSGSATLGVIGNSNSSYTSTLLANAIQGSGAMLNATSKLSLIAYGAYDNKFYIRPTVLNNDDSFSFYPPIVLTDVVREVKVLRVSDTQALVIYYIPLSNQVVIRLIGVSSNLASTLSQSNISGPVANYPAVYAMQALPGSLTFASFQAVYENNLLVISTGTDTYVYTISSNTLALAYIVNKTTNAFTQPTTIIRSNNYWYCHHVMYYGYPYNSAVPTAAIAGVMYVINHSTQSLVFKDESGVAWGGAGGGTVNVPLISASGSVGGATINKEAFGFAQLVSASGASNGFTPTTSSPFYSLTSDAGNSFLPGDYQANLMVPYFVSQIGNKLITLSNTKVLVSTQNTTTGTFATAPSTNLLGLSSPSVTHSFFGRLTDSKACIITNGIIAVVYI